jgi:hypothetical protein
VAARQAGCLRHEGVFTLGEIKGHAQRVLAVAASMKSADQARAAYNRLIARSSQLVDETERYYRDYLANTQLSCPCPTRICSRLTTGPASAW